MMGTFTQGMISEVNIYDWALTSQEVLNLYASQEYREFRRIPPHQLRTAHRATKRPFRINVTVSSRTFWNPRCHAFASIARLVPA